MKKKKKVSFKSNYILAAITTFCLLMIFLSFVTDMTTGPARTFSGFVIVPMQNGINNVGEWLTQRGDYFKGLDDLVKENQELKKEIEELTAENSLLVQDQYKLKRYEELLELSESYDQFDTVAAKVISHSTDNWFTTFTIDRGTDHGVDVDMNVIAGGGLVGIVTEAGPKWATVRTILDDVSSVSGKVLSTSDTCVVAGDLSLLDSGKLHILKLTDTEDGVKEGDAVTTSHISKKFHEGILIGYIDSIALDSNNITKSGTITPVVDFRHLQEVLVITELKELPQE